MPELPEVETICRALQTKLVSQEFTAIKIIRRDLRIQVPEDLAIIGVNSRILNISRRAKYITIQLENGYSVVIHLGMSGRITTNQKGYTLLKHDHIQFQLSNGEQLIFNDPRRFGVVTIYKTYELQDTSIFKSLGLEPFDNKFNEIYLLSKLQRKELPIKLALMDNKIVVGVGNIYACESLYRAGISPLRKSKNITLIEAARLIAKIQEVLNEAINYGGSTLKDYRSLDAERGNFKIDFQFMGEIKKLCLSCKEHIIREKQGEEVVSTALSANNDVL